MSAPTSELPASKHDIRPIPISNPTLSSHIIELKKDEVLRVCTCGLSLNFPRCDGSHKKYNAENKTNFKSMPLSEKEHGDTLFICGCGYSNSYPMCDGSHSELNDSQKETIVAQAAAFKVAKAKREELAAKEALAQKKTTWCPFAFFKYNAKWIVPVTVATIAAVVVYSRSSKKN